MSEHIHVTIPAKDIADNLEESYSNNDYFYQPDDGVNPLSDSPVIDSLQKIINSWQAVWGVKSETVKLSLNRISNLLNDDLVPLDSKLKIASDELAKIPGSPVWAVRLSEKLARMGTQLTGINRLQTVYKNLRQDPFDNLDSNLALLLELAPDDISHLLTQVQLLFTKLASIPKIMDVNDAGLTDSERWLRKIIEEFTQAKGQGNKKEMVQLFLMLAQEPMILTLVENYIDPVSELAAALNSVGLITAEMRKPNASPFGTEPDSYISQTWHAIDLTHRLTHPDFTGALQQTSSLPTVKAIGNVLTQVRSTMTPNKVVATAIDDMFELTRGDKEITLSRFLLNTLGAIDYWSLGKTIISRGMKFLSAPVILIARLGYAVWDSGFFQKLEDAPFAAIPYLAINELNRVINDPDSSFYKEIANIPVVGSTLRLLLQSFADLLQHGLFNTDRWLELMYQHFRQFMHDNPLAILFEQLIKIGLMVRLWRACRIGASNDEVTAAHDDLNKVIEWLPQENFRFMLQVIDFIPVIRRVYDHAQALRQPGSVNKEKGETPMQWGMKVMALLSGVGVSGQEDKNQAEILKTQQMLAEKLLGINMRAMEEATETALVQEMVAQQPQSSEFLTPLISDNGQASFPQFPTPTAEDKQGWLNHSQEWMARSRASAESAITYAASGVNNWAAHNSLTKALSMTQHAVTIAKESTTSAAGYVAKSYKSVTDRWNGLSSSTKNKTVLSGVFIGASAIGVYAFIHNIKSRYDLSRLEEEKFLTINDAKIAQEETERELIDAEKQLSISRGFTLGLGILSGGLLAAGAGNRLWEWIESRNESKSDAGISLSMKQDVSLLEMHNEQQQYLLKQSPKARDSAMQQAIKKRNEAGVALNTTKAEVRKAAEFEGKSGQEAVNTSSEVAAEKEAYDFFVTQAESIEHIIRTAFINGGRMDESTFKESLKDHQAWFRAGEKAGALLVAPTMLSGLFWWAAKRKQTYLKKRLVNLSDPNIVLFSHLRQQLIMLRQEEKRLGTKKSIVHPSSVTRETRRRIDELIDQIDRSNQSVSVGLKGEYVDIAHPLVYSMLKDGTRQLNLIRPYSANETINEPATNLDVYKSSKLYQQSLQNIIEYEGLNDTTSVEYLDEIKNMNKLIKEVEQKSHNLSDNVVVPDYVNDWLEQNTNKSGEEFIDVEFTLHKIHDDDTISMTTVTKKCTLEGVLSPGFDMWALAVGARDVSDENIIVKKVKINWPSSEDFDVIIDAYESGISEEYAAVDESIKEMVITPQFLTEAGDVAKAEFEKETQHIEESLEDYKKLNAMSWVDQKIIQIGEDYGTEINPDENIIITSHHYSLGGLHARQHDYGNTITKVSLREYLLYRVSKYTEIKSPGKPVGSVSSIEWPKLIKDNQKELNGKKLSSALVAIDFEDSVKEDLSNLRTLNKMSGLNEIIKGQITQLTRGYGYSKDFMRQFYTEKTKSASQVLFAVPSNFQSMFDSYDHSEQISGMTYYFYAIPGVFAIPVLSVNGKKRAVLISVIKNQAKMLDYTTNKLVDNLMNMEMNGGEEVTFFSKDIEKWLIDHISLRFNVKSLVFKKRTPKHDLNSYPYDTYNTLLGFSNKKYDIDEIPNVMINSLLNKTVEDVSAMYVSSGEYWDKIVKDTLKLLMSAVGAVLFAAGVLVPNPALLWATVGLSATIVLTPMIISYFTADTLQDQDNALRGIITWIAMEALNIGITKIVQLSVMPELTRMSKVTSTSVMSNVLRNRQKKIFENYKNTSFTQNGGAATPSADSFLAHLRSPGVLRAHRTVPASVASATRNSSTVKPLIIPTTRQVGPSSPATTSTSPATTSTSASTTATSASTTSISASTTSTSASTTSTSASTSTTSAALGETSDFLAKGTSNIANDEWIKNLVRLALGLYKTVGKPQLGKMMKEGLKSEQSTAGFVPASSRPSVIESQISTPLSQREAGGSTEPLQSPIASPMSMDEES